jgi:circadian clock protein KaiC
MLFMSGYHAFMEKGLDGFLKLIATCLHENRPSLLIVDGSAGKTDLSLSKFIHELNALVAAMNCTTLLLAPLSGNEPHPEHTLVDGPIEPNRYSDGRRRSREIEVHKMRGRDHLPGKHFFRITDTGHVMFPKLEARCATRPDPADLKTRLTFDVPRLDTLAKNVCISASRNHRNV